MITADPFLLILALVSLLLWARSAMDNDKWQRWYMTCFIVSIVGAYIFPT